MTTPGSAPAIAIRGLRKEYGSVQALAGIDLTIEKGQFFGLLGPNGAGKSTTIHIVTGLVKFQQGDVRVLGHDVVDDYRFTRRAIGLAPQEFNFDRFFSIREILILQAGYYGIARTEAARRADILLERFGLSAKSDQKIHKLSGGMKRRLLIAKGMIHDPEILILDEPTAGVDVELRRALWSYLRALNARGTTVLLTTHYIEEAEELCDEVAIIDHGQIISQGSPRGLIESSGGQHLEICMSDPISGELPESVLRHDHTVDDRRLVVVAPNPREIVPEILGSLYRSGREITEFRIMESSLEDVFISLTGHGIDEAPTLDTAIADGAPAAEEELHEV